MTYDNRVHEKIHSEISQRAAKILRRLNVVDDRVHRSPRTVTNEPSKKVFKLDERLGDLDTARSVFWKEVTARYEPLGTPEFVSVHSDFFGGIIAPEYTCPERATER